MVNFGLLAAEIFSLDSGTAANFNGFRVLVALLHGTLIVGVSQSLRRRTEGATYIRQGGHQVGHRPTFLVAVLFYNICKPKLWDDEDRSNGRFSDFVEWQPKFRILSVERVNGLNWVTMPNFVANGQTVAGI